MAASLHFATRIYRTVLSSAVRRRLNPRLLAESLQLRRDDPAGRRWSAANYPGGYTSYGSQCRMQNVSPTFAALEDEIDRHVLAFARELDFDLRGRKLGMTDCWVNIMRRRVAHGSHAHPLSTISGTFYVRVPPGSSGLKFEDPRLGLFMAAPPRRTRVRGANATWVTVDARDGQLVLFESWLRHEVPAQPVGAERVSVSFNYSWF